jgi:hypothetical protein
MLNLNGKRTYTGNPKNFIYTFLTIMFKIEPAIIPPNEYVASDFAAFFIALPCLSGTS